MPYSPTRSRALSSSFRQRDFATDIEQSDTRDDQPLQKGGEAGAEWWDNGHCLGVGPALAYPGANETIAENGVAKAEENRGERHAPAKNRPAPHAAPSG